MTPAQIAADAAFFAAVMRSLGPLIYAPNAPVPARAIVGIGIRRATEEDCEHAEDGLVWKNEAAEAMQVGAAVLDVDVLTHDGASDGGDGATMTLSFIVGRSGDLVFMRDDWTARMKLPAEPAAPPPRLHAEEAYDELCYPLVAKLAAIAKEHQFPLLVDVGMTRADGEPISCTTCLPSPSGELAVATKRHQRCVAVLYGRAG